MKLLLLLSAMVALASSSAVISPGVFTDLLKSPKIGVFLSFRNGNPTPLLTNLTRSFEMAKTPKAQRADAVYYTLKAHSEVSQKRTLDFLKRFKTINFQTFWISNEIFVDGVDRELLFTLASLPDVSKITENIVVVLDDVTESVQKGLDRNGGPFEWGIRKIQAPQAWQEANGKAGDGIVVGIIDTGVRGTHETLRDNWVGGLYGWYDAYNQKPLPFDDNGHGSHVTGTICGSKGIGVAPGAKWQGCKAFGAGGSGSRPQILACGQFFACPHHPDGSQPDCSKAPHLVSNSWGSGGSGLDWYNEVIAAWRAGGIIPVFSAGNSGPNCQTVRSPGDNVDVIAVGATVEDETIASFSSVGPSSVSLGSQKPEVSAPGASVRSAHWTEDDAYSTKSGTSMAAPHVSGLVALAQSFTLGQDRELTYDEIKDLLQKNTWTEMTSQGKVCHQVPDNTFPNYHFGFGRIDALKTVKALKGSF